MPSLYEPIKKVGQKVAEWFAPRSDAAVTGEAYEIAMELPGVDLGDVDIALQDGMLIVTGEKRFEHEETGKSYFFSEREYGAFQRAFRVPADADPDAIDAELKNGILRILLPKKRTVDEPTRKVAVRIG
jgi:HSP20 family protein